MNNTDPAMSLINGGVGNVQGQELPAMSLINGGIGNVQGQQLPPEAIKSAQKTLTKYYDAHAEQLVNQPGGAEILASLIKNAGGLKDNPEIKPAKGMFQSASVTPEGNIQRGGIFGGFTGPTTDMLLKQLMTLSEINKNNTKSTIITPEAQMNTVLKMVQLAKEAGLDPNNLSFGTAANGVGTINLNNNRASASLQNYKDKRTEQVISTVNDSDNAINNIDMALNSVNKLQSGLGGKVTYNVIKSLDANNPLLGDWQNLKAALTEAQIAASGPLKGAISDTEEKWLAAAAANDDLISIPRANSVLNKLRRAIDTKKRSVVDSYKKIYKEDPYQWEELKGNNNTYNKNKEKEIDNSGFIKHKSGLSYRILS